jgi:hypothetical protein
MKPSTILQLERRGRIWASLVVVGVGVSTASAADTNAPPEMPEPLTPEQVYEGGTNAYLNWIDFSLGGFMTSGNRARAQTRRQSSRGAFGGIEDFHYQAELDKTTLLSVDGRALFDNDDYKISLDVRREEAGYLRFSYNEFRLWSSGDGGYYRPTDKYHQQGDDALALDRGEIIFEGGLTLEKIPQINFKYTHNFREGEKSSTIWGITHPAVGVTRGLSPALYELNERSDALQLDLTNSFKTTDFGVGLRYEHGRLDNALKITQSPGEPSRQRITDHQGTAYDLFNVHAFTETWIKKNLLLSSGYSFSDLDNDFSGRRIYGSDFDLGYAPSTQNGLGYYGLHGGSRRHEHVFNLNLMYKPVSSFTITPSIRVQEEVMEASSSGYQTLGAYAASPFNAGSDANRLDVRERLDFTYTGLTNCVLYLRGEWTEGGGNLHEYGGLGTVNGIGVPPIRRETDDSRFFQKYSAGVRWYPTRRITLNVGGCYKINRYDYEHDFDSTPNDSINRYPAYLVMQDFETYDGKVRLMLRPWQNVTLASRYEYQVSTLHTKPDSSSGLGQEETSEMISHILAQDISWTPWSRLNLQAGVNYVWSRTKTPTSDYTQAILDAQNNYWTVNVNSTFVVDDRTDLNLGYLYYRADDYEDNALSGVPYGAGAEEHGITAGLIRRFSKNVQLSLRYGFYHYTDASFGGHQDYEAHVVSSSLRYRF